MIRKVKKNCILVPNLWCHVIITSEKRKLIWKVQKLSTKETPTTQLIFHLWTSLMKSKKKGKVPIVLADRRALHPKPFYMECLASSREESLQPSWDHQEQGKQLSWTSFRAEWPNSKDSSMPTIFPIPSKLLVTLQIMWCSKTFWWIP